MKFVALVSGGKDSCFNILHCLAQGHKLVALANLHPEDKSQQELDSFMFQTVGHDILDYYSECCEVPMYRQAILGKSKNQNLEYDTTFDDEIEDLYQLLVKVKTNHPDVQAVSVGAILSSYQRTRVEHVCQRLGLVSLAYLWQRDQLELMTEMCQSGLDARLIKVAAVGLNETHLVKSIQEMLPVLVKLNLLYDVHICGEGGEFETIVLDAPFFKHKKLEIVNKQIIRDSGDVYYLTLQVKVVPKQYNEVLDWAEFVTRPSLLSEEFQDIYDLLENDFTLDQDQLEKIFYELFLMEEVKVVGNKTFISNLISTQSLLEHQVVDVFSRLETLLNESELTFENIQSSQLLVASMANFGRINSIYQNYFNRPLPPSRICVETILPNNRALQLSVTLLNDLKEKKGIHIQGRSYWAPSNIGPYSQAIVDTKNNIATISGQIPLIPSSMELCDNPRMSTVISLQHFHQVKQLIGLKESLSTVAFITSKSYLNLVLDTWKAYDLNALALIIVVQVTSLPRGAGVEWGGLTFKSIQNPVDDSEDEDSIAGKLNQLTICTDETFRKVNGEVFDTIFLNGNEIDKFDDIFDRKYHYVVYSNPLLVTAQIKSFINRVHSEFVPVLSVWNGAGVKFELAVVVRAV